MVVNGPFEDTSGVKVGVYQDSDLSLLPFIILLIALSIKIWTDRPWELLCADDFVLISQSLEGSLTKLTEGEIHFQVNGLITGQYS